MFESLGEENQKILSDDETSSFCKSMLETYNFYDKCCHGFVCLNEKCEKRHKNDSKAKVRKLKRNKLEGNKPNAKKKKGDTKKRMENQLDKQMHQAR